MNDKYPKRNYLTSCNTLKPLFLRVLEVFLFGICTSVLSYNKLPQAQQLETIQIYYLTVLWLSSLVYVLCSSSYQTEVKVLPGSSISSEAKAPLLAHWFLAKFSSLQMQGQGACFLADYQQGTFSACRGSLPSPITWLSPQHGNMLL